MALHKINKGLDLPITGEPVQQVQSEPRISRVAVLGDDFVGMKPRMLVQEGDTVRRGQPLFEDRKTPGVVHTAPGAGRVMSINRGAKRALQSVVVQLSETEVAGQPSDSEYQPFGSFKAKSPEEMTPTEVKDLMVESGLWTALRTRPFSRVPELDSEPQALFVTAIDSNPLAPEPSVVIAEEKEAFELGLKLLSKLCPGTTYVCVRQGAPIDAGSAPVQVESFDGPHPSGTVGLHIHLLHPVSRARVVWHVGYQDVISLAKLATSGKLDVARVVSLAGPKVQSPRLVKARLGAWIDDVAEREFDALGDQVRVISGSVLSGKKAMGSEFGFLGRYHSQVSVIGEDRQRELVGWLKPGGDRFSTLPIFISKLFGGKKFDFTTSTNGSARAMVPIGMYERVMPMDILPTFLLRAMVVGDVERAEQLGALELDEEDLALCTFVCTSKTNYGVVLRKNLQTIQEEG